MPDLYTSASVLLAAKLCPALERDLDYASMEISWKRCIEILRDLESQYDSARRCLATLEAIHEQIIAPQQAGIGPGTIFADSNAQMDAHIGDKVVPHLNDNVLSNQDPLLQYNTDNVTQWGSRDMDFGWFFENPMWDSPDFTTGP